MNQIQVRKIIRGVRSAADFALLQLHYSAIHVEGARPLLEVTGFCQESLRLYLHALIQKCDDYIQREGQSLAQVRSSYGVLARARGALSLALLSEPDDIETMRFLQLAFLTEALRVLSRRIFNAEMAELSL